MKKKPITNILAPTDFSDCAANALKAAIALAKLHKAKLTLLHVVQGMPELYGIHKERATKEQHSDYLLAQSAMLSSLTVSIKDTHKLTVVPLIIAGQIVDTICHTANGLEIDLIIMGTHGITGFKEFLIGSNTYGVTEKAAAPVLSVPLKAKTRGFKKVLFPVRNIPNALDKYKFLKIFIHNKPSRLVVYGIYKIDDAEMAASYKKVGKFVTKIAEEWTSVKLTSVITDENHADEVIERGIEMKCDLIVITAKVGESLKDFFLGKFAQQMVNHSTLPVLHIK